MSGSTTEKTYEMLWDCKYCGQRKLLGVTHRFCANCGAPQDAAARYFPSDEEKVAVQDHRFVGADLRCPACASWNSRSANCCTHCGGPLTAGQEARLRAEQVRREGERFAGETVQDARRDFGQAPGAVQPQPRRKGPGAIIAVLAVVGLGIVALVLALIFWTKGAALEVAGHTWERTIDIEAFGPVRKSAWCDELPAGARELGRHREQRSTKKVPDGEDCQTRRKDQGDGTFKEIRECRPKYREEPVMDDRCDYEVNEWSRKDVARASGASLKEPPAWPQVVLQRPGSCVGCQREGKRAESYVVRFADTESKKAHQCTFPETKWASFPVGSRWVGKVGVLTGSLDCDALQKQ
jgi:hypothetical protein